MPAHSPFRFLIGIVVLAISARARLVVGQEIVVIGVAETPAGSTGTIVAVDDPAAPRWIQVVTDVGSQDWMPVESGLPM